MVAINAPPGHSHAFHFSLALIEAMGNSGMTIVSLQPTPEMVQAGAKAGKVDAATATRIYSAMVGLE
jgi:hypothetical protein